MTANQHAGAAPAQLRRSLGVGLLTLYGLGNILGAGIYVLVGEVVGQAGLYAPLAFVLAAIVASLSAFSYGELSARYPQSAGEAIYVQEAFNRKSLSIVVGSLIALAGMVSAATLARGFVGYFQTFAALSDVFIIIGLVTLLAFIAAWGITESVRVAAVLTLIEGAGLVLIISVAMPDMAEFGERFSQLPDISPMEVQSVLLGAFLAFYAYIGFEDMVNIAEEVKQPEKNLPRAILISLVVSTILYLLVVIVSLTTLTVEQLATSNAPLATVFQHATGRSPWLISVIGGMAILNGALIQIIMAARVFYGMSRRGWLPRTLGRVNAKSRTPVHATALVALTICVLALWFPLIALAKGTSFLLLIIFALVNLALIVIKLRQPTVAHVRPIAMWIPVLGLIASAALVGAQGLFD